MFSEKHGEVWNMRALLRLQLMCSLVQYALLRGLVVWLIVPLFPLFVSLILSFLAFCLPTLQPVLSSTPRGHHTKDEICSISNPRRIGRIC